MKRYSPRFLLAFGAAAVLVAGCATIPQEHIDGPLISPEKSPPPFRESRPPTFLRSYDVDSKQVTERVELNGAELYAVLRAAIPGATITPSDTGVDLRREVTFMGGPMPVVEFLRRMENITNLSFEYYDDNINVASVVSKQWRMPAYTSQQASSSRVTGQSETSGGGGSGVPSSPGPGAAGGGGGASAGGSGGRGSNLNVVRNSDEWGTLIALAQNFADNVVAMRSQGIIKATGRPLAMRELDRLMLDLQRSSQTIIALDVTTFEVTLDDRRARGIDWSTILDGVFKNTSGGFTLGAGGSFPANIGDEVTGGFGIDFSANPSGTPVDVMFTLLSEFGKVQLEQQPKVTTLNGKTAFISSGEEFGFVSEVRSTVTANLATVEPTFERILVGVELSITPIQLDDGRIMVEVVPIVSNFRGFDNFEVGDNQSSQPRIALQQLATTTIARPGETFKIGGLIRSRLASELSRLPLGQRESLGIAGYLLESEANLLDRSELVIMITPTLVGA